MDSKRIGNLILTNFIQKISFVARQSSSMHIQETDNYIRVDCGLPADTFNISVLKNRDLTTIDETLFEETINYFNKKAYPMAFWVWGEMDSSSLISKGLEESEVNIGMYIHTSDIVAAEGAASNFTIREVGSSADVVLFGKTLSHLFGESQEAIHVAQYYSHLSATDLWKKPAMKLYIGLYNNDVVSVGSLIYTKDSVGIYDIATVNEHRNKGFGAAMFNFLLQEIKKQFSGICILQSSKDGFSIYKKAGFQEVCKIQVFENRSLVERL